MISNASIKRSEIEHEMGVLYSSGPYFNPHIRKW